MLRVPGLAHTPVDVKRVESPFDLDIFGVRELVEIMAKGGVEEGGVMAESIVE